MKGLSENGRFENRRRMNDYAAEAVGDTRFPFGQNWRRFVSLLDEKRIIAAEKSLREMLEIDDLKGKTLLNAYQTTLKRNAKAFNLECV